jgi:hypothetical protein
VVVSKCAVYEDGRVESLPILYDEICKFDYMILDVELYLNSLQKIDEMKDTNIVIQKQPKL